jgi:hypothetical protein
MAVFLCRFLRLAKILDDWFHESRPARVRRKRLILRLERLEDRLVPNNPVANADS